MVIGKSRAGNTTKIHLAVDGYGLPVEFEVTGGEVNDCSVAPDLIARLPGAKAIVADKGYDCENMVAMACGYSVAAYVKCQQTLMKIRLLSVNSI